MAFAIMLIIAVALAVRLNRSIEDTLGLSIFGIITILYVSGLITVFDPGLYIVYLICGISAIYIIIILIRNKHLKVFNVNFFIYFLVAVYFLFVSYGRFFNQIDDFIHWAIATKYYYIYSDFSNASFTSDWAWKYPPFATLWAYFFTKNWVSCSSGMMLWGQQIFILSLLAPILKLNHGKDKIIRMGSFVLFFVTLPYWVFPVFSSYFTLMPDILIGVMFFYILFNYRTYCKTDDKFYLFVSLFGCFAITLVKTTGIIHVLLLLFVVFSYNIKVNTSLKNNFRQLMLYGTVSLVSYISWNVYTIVAGDSIVSSMVYSFEVLVNKKVAVALIVFMLLSGGMTVIPISKKFMIELYNKYRQYVPEAIFVVFSICSVLLAICTDYGDHEWTYYFSAFVEFWCDMTEAQAGYLIRLPIALFVVLLAIVINRIIDNTNDKILWNLVVTSFVMYATFRCLGRMIVTPDEYPLSSLGRYMYSGLVVVIIFGFCMAIEYLKNGKKSIVIIAVILAFTNSSISISSLFNKTEEYSFPALDGIDFDVTDKVFLVDPFIDEDRCELLFMYEAAPALYSGNAYEATWYLGNDLTGRRLTVNEVTSKLNENEIDYVYLRKTDEGFEDYYSELFSDDDEIGAEHLYRVLRMDNNENIKLELVN